MPIYEYTCEDCGERSALLVRGDTEPVCPKCEGASLTKELSVFAVGNTRMAAPAPSGGCGSCGDPRGPGACRLD